MRVYHGTWSKEDNIIPIFITPSFSFAKWFAETGVDEKEDFYVLEYQLSNAEKIADLDTSIDFMDPQNSWRQIEDDENTLKWLQKTNIGVWMTEKSEPTIMLFKPEEHLTFIKKHSFIKQSNFK